MWNIRKFKSRDLITVIAGAYAGKSAVVLKDAHECDSFVRALIDGKIIWLLTRDCQVLTNET